MMSRKGGSGVDWVVWVIAGIIFLGAAIIITGNGPLMLNKISELAPKARELIMPSTGTIAKNVVISGVS